MTIITGARQTGKTTLLFQIKEYLLKNNVKESQIKYFNLDLISNWQHLKFQDEFIKYLKEQILNEKFIYVFIDEVQKIDNPGVYLKGIYDLNLPIKLVVSGSYSLEIKSKMFESLTGRKRVFNLWTFSFEEYLSYVFPEVISLDFNNLSKITEDILMQHLYDYMIFGGYPKVVLAESKQEKIKILEEIYSSYIEKDVIGFMRIKNQISFTKLVSVIASQCGKLVNFKEILQH
ncbi:MAG: AAA family ATPase [Candidatus Aenigmatarchaeota archaeon]